MRALSLAAVIALTATTSAFGQVRFEIEAAFGLYSGLSSFDRPVATTPVATTETLGQEPALTLGGQLTGWIGSGIGVRAVGLTSSSAVAFAEGNFYEVPPVPATVTILALEALFPFQEFSNGLRIYGGGGIGMVLRGGEAYQGFQGTDDLAALLVLGSSYPLSSRIALQGDFQAALYGLQLTDPTGVVYPSAFQTDLLITFGLAVR